MSDEKNVEDDKDADDRDVKEPNLLSPKEVDHMHEYWGRQIDENKKTGGVTSYATMHAMQMSINEGVWMVARILARALEERDK